MASEELEITVNANTEPALKKIKQLMPQITEEVSKITKTTENLLEQIDIKKFINKVSSAIKFVKNKIEELKKSNQNNELTININNEEVQKQISQVQKEIDSLLEKINARQIEIINPGIIQNIINALRNLLSAINNVIESVDFKNWLNNCSDKIKEMSEKLSSINWQPLIDSLSSIGMSIGIAALDTLNGLVDIFKWMVENPIIVEILLAIAVAIKTVSIALTIWKLAQELLDSTLLKSPITWIIIAITALISIIVLCIMHWEDIKNTVVNTWEVIKNAVIEAIEPIKNYLTNLCNDVSFIFQAIWDVISTILGFIWNIFKTVFEAIWNIVSPIINAIWTIISTIFQSIWNIISSILNSIWNIFSQIFNWVWQLTSKVFQAIWNIIAPIMNNIWENIKLILNKIQQMWSTIWNSIAGVINTVWNCIWNCIKGIINLILNGIENFVNGTIRGINKLLSGISSVANAIGSLIGINPISLQISTISLPRLAKGNVAYSPMVALFGEYSGASTNPEITAPQNVMRDTFSDVLSEHGWQNNVNTSPMQLSVFVGNKKLGDILLDNLRDKRRQTGNSLEVLVGG